MHRNWKQFFTRQKDPSAQPRGQHQEQESHMFNLHVAMIVRKSKDSQYFFLLVDDFTIYPIVYLDMEMAILCQKWKSTLFNIFIIGRIQSPAEV